MITQTDGSKPRMCGDIVLSAAPQGRYVQVGSRFERRIAPFYAPSTGAVRPQAGNHAMADMTRGIGDVKGLSWGRAWSPPV